MDPSRIADWIPQNVRVVSDAELRARAEQHRRHGYRDMHETLVRSLPDRFAWAHFSAPELRARVPAPAIDAAKQVVDRDVVVFIGPPGAGKTSLAVAMLRAWLRRHRRVALFVAARDLAHARIQHRAGQGESPVVEEALRAGLVLLDDVGAEAATLNDALPDVVAARHNACRPTWITTGLSRGALVARYDGGILRRLVDSAAVIQVRPVDRGSK